MVRIELSGGEQIDAEASIDVVADRLWYCCEESRFMIIEKPDGKKVIIDINEINTITEL